MITGGAREVWATAVVYVVARLNVLFDRDNPNYLPPDTICGHFGTKKGTVSARAAEIDKARAELDRFVARIADGSASDAITSRRHVKY